MSVSSLPTSALQRRWALLVATLVGSILLAGAALWHLHGIRQQAQEAALILTQCRALAQDLRAMRDRPRLAQAQERPLQELTRHIEQAAAAAHMTSAHLIRIWPENANRLGDTAYLEKPTQLLLHDVTLEQITRFLTAMSGADPTLTIPTLRLTADNDAASDKHWTAEISLNYLIHAPRATDDPAIAVR
jgi:hypothetical protein